MKIFTLIIPVLFLTSCDVVLDKEWKTGIKVCEQHNGVAQVKATLSVVTAIEVRYNDSIHIITKVNK